MRARVPSKSSSHPKLVTSQRTPDWESARPLSPIQVTARFRLAVIFARPARSMPTTANCGMSRSWRSLPVATSLPTSGGSSRKGEPNRPLGTCTEIVPGNLCFPKDGKCAKSKFPRATVWLDVSRYHSVEDKAAGRLGRSDCRRSQRPSPPISKPSTFNPCNS